MAKKNDIVTELQLVIKKESGKIIDKISVAPANELYNKLLRDGVIRKRGNTLRSLDDYQLTRHTVSNNKTL